jgi:hypothetical protein
VEVKLKLSDFAANSTESGIKWFLHRSEVWIFQYPTGLRRKTSLFEAIDDMAVVHLYLV